MITEVYAKTILRKAKYIDSWFLSRYTVNLFRGCMHDCVYCDGRDEKYRVEGDFGREVSVKVNAAEILERELDPQRKRKPFERGYMFVCGGVSDSYQHLEKQYGMTRKTLGLMLRFGHPVHMLTKSVLIERDLKLLTEIKDTAGAVVSFSFSTVDDALAAKLEPAAARPSKRLDTIKRFKDAGFACGIYQMPAVPFLTDSPEMIGAVLSAAKDAGADFAVFGGMTLKPGRQADHFLSFIQKEFPLLVPEYRKLYARSGPWGGLPPAYSAMLGRRFAEASAALAMPRRMPPMLWPEGLGSTARILLFLDQLDYLATLSGLNSPYGRAMRALSMSERPVESLSEAELRSFGGVGGFTAGLIREIIDTGSSLFYERLLTGR